MTFLQADQLMFSCEADDEPMILALETVDCKMDCNYHVLCRKFQADEKVSHAHWNYHGSQDV